MTLSWFARIRGAVSRRPAGNAGPRDFSQPVRTLLVTGSEGGVARLLWPLLAREGYALRGADLAARGDERRDLTRPRDCERAVRGVDAVLHLAGAPKEGSVSELWSANSLALDQLLRSAGAASVSRFVFASSMHVMGLYDRTEAIDESMPPRPDGNYAASKLHGEALCRVHAEKNGLAVTCLRLGAVGPTLAEVEPASWISPEDVMAMVRIALRADRPGFEIFHAVADAPGSPLPPSRAAAFGYVCSRPGEAYAVSLERVARTWPNDPWARTRRGASFASQTLR